MISYSMDRHWKCVGKGLARSADGRAAAERLTYKSRTQEMQPGARSCFCVLYAVILQVRKVGIPGHSLGRMNLRSDRGMIFWCSYSAKTACRNPLVLLCCRESE